jgi:hypothetical protein
MQAQETTEYIKILIRGFASREESVPLSFFDRVRPQILEIVRMNPATGGIDEITLNDLYTVAVKEYKSVNPIDIDPSSALTKEGFQSWLTEERKAILPKNYIDRYLKYLRQEGRSENVIEEISRSSESILGKLGDPQSSTAFYTKGLVVGSVQSGKTGNFNAVINRATDAGYNLIIILSGIMEDLRSQTQLRMELDIIGEGVTNLQTEQQGIKGVGKITRFGIQGNQDVPQVFSITSHKSDFKKQVQDANFSLNNKNLLVCKKNSGVLKNLLIWLSDYLVENEQQHEIPLLIVDDEADNASLNNLGHKGREYATTINGHIRAILALFSKKTYLGYTATPFANVLQDRNPEGSTEWVINYKRNGEPVTRSFRQVPNIFPDDFIELLMPPSNYIGAFQIFETAIDSDIKKIPLVEPVSDWYDSFPAGVVDGPDGTRPATVQEIEDEDPDVRSPKREDVFPVTLPESLIEAIECFILSIAVRLKRRPSMAGSKLFNQHSTMLIHISRFTDWQNRTRNLVQGEVEKLSDRIAAELPSSADSVYAKLEKTWYKYYAAIVENIRTYLPAGYSDEFLDPVTFDEIKSLLPQAVKGLEVKAINSVTKEKLLYTTDSSGNGKKYIAIGGNRLSRGFTLEGLTINYFLRDTNYADTLLQMGRWFGYRPGYIDCCKLFTTWDAIAKFDATTRTIEELEVEFKKMERLGKTPNQFVLRVRNHPSVLQITRPSILKNTVSVKWSYQDTLVQTTQFDMNADRINRAWTELKQLLEEYRGRFTEKRGFYYADTDIAGLKKFLDCTNSFHEFSAELNQIKIFLDRCETQSKLINWRIAVKATGTGETIGADQTATDHILEMSVRSGPGRSQTKHRKQLIEKGVFTGSGRSANIVSSGLDMSLWLSDDEVRQADLRFTEDKKEELMEEGMTAEEAQSAAEGKTKPERIYRERMGDQNGLLVIYLMDMRAVLKNDDAELMQVKRDRNIDETVPLIGYALAFPPISPDPGGHYVRGNYNIEEDEPEAEEFDEESLNSNEENI